MKTPQQEWWESLSPEWQQAFIQSVLGNTAGPTQEDLVSLLNLQVLRVAGPSAPHSNCSVLLPDLSGVQELRHLEILIVSHHALTKIEEVSGLRQLKALFLFNNRISSLQGIEALTQLEQLYINSNELHSIKEIEGLTNLKELYISDNRLTSLDGLTEIHAENLQKFVCMPNKGLKPKEILKLEREVGLMCR